MPGGILQLVAKGVDDLFIIGNPEITFFKTMYRRHTNFSRGEIDLQFQTKVDFSREAKCRIQRWGDLLHRLYLVINLPEIDIVFVTITIGQVQTILAEVDIIYETNRPPDSIFNQSAFDEVCILINNKIDETRSIIEIEQKILQLFEPNGELHYATFFAEGGTNDQVDEYYDKVNRRLIEFDQYNLEYKFVDDHDMDRMPGLLLANSSVLQDLLFDKFVEYTTGATTFDPISYNDENLLFMYNTDTANYNIGGSTNELNSNTVFRAGISNAYGTEVFNNLDAFKIFDTTLNNNISIITNNFGVQQIKSLLLDNIRFGLIKNVKLQRNIYNSLANDSKFILYRYLQRVSVGNYDPNSGDFVNLSLVASNEPEFNDNFTTDFNIPLETDEPSDVDHPFSNMVKDEVSTFHNDNTKLYRESIFVDYFDTVSLWERTDAGEIGNISPTCGTLATAVANGQIPPSFFNMYHLNFIPYLTNVDIVEAIDRYLRELQSNGESIGFRTSLNTALTILQNSILTALDTVICVENDFRTIDKLSNSFRSTPGSSGDIMYSSIIRLGTTLSFGGSTLLVTDYVINRYLDALDNFSASGYNQWKNVLKNVVNLFKTPIEEIPTYTSYLNLNNNQKEDLLINFDDNSQILSDVVSSIWYHIFNNFINNYNGLYNDKILGRDYYEENVGAELKRYLNELGETYFNSPIQPDGIPTIPIDYYIDTNQSLLPINNGAIGKYFSDPDTRMGKINIFEDQIDKFDVNRPLLDTENIIVPKSTYYFERFITVLNFITLDQIENNTDNFGNLIYFHEFHNDATETDPVLDVRESIINPLHPRYDPTEPKNNAMDIIILENSEFETFISTPINPFSKSTEPNKYALWNEYWLPTQKFDTTEERSKHTQLFGNINAKTLYTNITNIDVNYNGFANERDVYRYLLDIILKNSIINIIFDSKERNVIDTYEEMVRIFTEDLKSNEELLITLTGTENTTSLKEQLKRTLVGGESAKFAWIKYIGHYIIEYIQISINDQIIDVHTGEWLHLWHQLSKKDTKERGYNKLIGNLPELTSFDENKKRFYQLKNTITILVY